MRGVGLFSSLFLFLAGEHEEGVAADDHKSQHTQYNDQADPESIRFAVRYLIVKDGIRINNTVFFDYGGIGSVLVFI